MCYVDFVQSLFIECLWVSYFLIRATWFASKSEHAQPYGDQRGTSCPVSLAAVFAIRKHWGASTTQHRDMESQTNFPPSTLEMKPSEKRPRHFCRDLAEPGVNNVYNNVETLFTELQIHALSVLWVRMSPINKSRWINNTSMNCKCGLVRSWVCRVEGGLLAQVNEVVWECGLGPDCGMCRARFSLGGICSSKTTGETIFASGCVCTCAFECVCKDACVLMRWARDSVCDIALRMTLGEALLYLCLMLVFVH